MESDVSMEELEVKEMEDGNEDFEQGMDTDDVQKETTYSTSKETSQKCVTQIEDNRCHRCRKTFKNILRKDEEI